MRKSLHWLIDAFGILAAGFVFAIFIVMLGAAVMRSAGLSTGGSDDIVSWLTAAAAFFGMAHTFRHGDFVRMGLWLESLSPRARQFAEAFALLVATLFTAYLTYSVAAYVLDSYRFGDVADGLIPLKKWIPQLSIVIGAALLFLACADELFNVLCGNKPEYVLAVEARHAKGDFSEDM